jgi:hypothetical protein
MMLASMEDTEKEGLHGRGVYVLLDVGRLVGPAALAPGPADLP